MKERTNCLYFPVYDYEVHIIITEDIIASRNKRADIIGHKLADENNTYGLHSFKEGEPASYIFLVPKATPDEIVHESFHCIFRMMKHIGAEIEEEVFAYHLGYLVQKIDNFLKAK